MIRKLSMTIALAITAVFALVAMTASPAVAARVLYVGNDQNAVEDPGIRQALISAGFDVTKASRVPSSLEGFEVLIVTNSAIAEKDQDKLRELLGPFINNGGAFVSAYWVPWMMCGGNVFKADGPIESNLAGDLSSISEWFGASRYICATGGYSATPQPNEVVVVTDSSFGTVDGRLKDYYATITLGDQVLFLPGAQKIGGVDRNGLSATAFAEAMWGTNRWVAAFSNTYGKGRVYYQAVPYSPNYPKAIEMFITGTKWAAGVLDARAWIGIEVCATTTAQGVKVMDVLADRPAATAGIQPGDIITFFNGRKVRSTNDLGEAIRDAEVGETVTAKVIRGNESIELKVIPEDASKRPDTVRY